MQLKNTIKGCTPKAYTADRTHSASLGKAPAPPGDNPMASPVSPCVHESASVVKSCFVFKGGSLLEGGLERGLCGRPEENAAFQNKRFLKSSQLFLLFPAAFHYPLYAHLPVIANGKIQTIKKK